MNGQVRVIVRESSFLFALLFFVLNTQHACVFVKYFGIECPGCGMTRAIREVIHLHFASAFQYHPMVFSMPYVAFYIVKSRSGSRLLKSEHILMALIGLGFAITYVYRMLWSKHFVAR